MTRSLRIILLMAAMIVFLVGMVASYANDMKSGQEIILRSEPVDPRSLFRGNFVRLGYAIDSIDSELIGAQCIREKQPVYVTIKKSAEGWRPIAIAQHMPTDGFADNRVTLRGHALRMSSSCPESTPHRRDGTENIRVNYGFDAYFASEEAAKRLEDLQLSEEGLLIILSVPKNGRALIKGMVINGKRVIDQTIF